MKTAFLFCIFLWAIIFSSQAQTGSVCAPAVNLTVKPWATSTGNALECNWVPPVANGSYGVYINGKLYVGKEGFGQTSAFNQWCYCPGIPGGIQPNEKFEVFVRTWCNVRSPADTICNPCYDTPVTAIIIPSTFVGTCTETWSTGKKGGGKK